MELQCMALVQLPKGLLQSCDRHIQPFRKLLIIGRMAQFRDGSGKLASNL
jgi:hypothetical protein